MYAVGPIRQSMINDERVQSFLLEQIEGRVTGKRNEDGLLYWRFEKDEDGMLFQMTFMGKPLRRIDED